MENFRGVQEKIKLLSSQENISEQLQKLEPVLWFNPKITTTNSLKNVTLKKEDIFKANELWQRFSPFLQLKFPELQEYPDPSIESPVKKIGEMEKVLNERYTANIENLYIKCDHELPIAGSIKARGGFYEVLYYAEKLAMEHDLIHVTDPYEKFASNEMKEFFSQYTIGVGSTGNLGLSIGIMSAALGFNVSVYMSADAKKWKKDLLREKGAIVHEFSGDFGEAITKGRQLTNENPKGYFIDDEDSEQLFIGYSTAAIELQKQLKDLNIKVDEKNPLFLYLPCGVGGSPGGITFGVKQILGDHVHCFFVEPTECPSLLLGLATGKRDKISVHDIGISNRTEADGLAVGAPSKFATIYNEQLVSGIYTIEDDQLFEQLAFLKDSENIFVEPSATSGLLGPVHVLQSNYLEERNINPQQVTHMVWSTGGNLVPEEDREKFYQRGKVLA